MKVLLAFLLFATALTAGASVPPEVATDLSSPDLAKRFAAQISLQRLAFEAGNPGADPTIAASLSKELLGMALNASLPEETRLSALKQLPFLADGSCVPGLASALGDPLIREAARCALQNNPDPAASQPLIDALEKADQPLWVLGLMQALEARKEAAAVPQINARLASTDPAIASLAAQYLGTIGGKTALDALVAYLPTCPPSNLAVTQIAMIRCALPLTKEPVGFMEKIMAQVDKWMGKPTASETISSLWPTAANAAMRCEIFKAMLASGNDEGALKILQEVLAAPTTPGTREILHLAVLSGTPAFKQLIVAALPGLDQDSRLAVHAALAEAGDFSQEADLLAFASTLQGQKKAAAIEVLAVCGTEKSLDFLVAEFALKDRQTLPAISLALNRLPVPGLDERLFETVKGPDAAKSREAIGLLAQRNPPGVEAFFLNLAGPTAPNEGRPLALAALESVGSVASAKQLLAWIATAPQGVDPKPFIATFRRMAPRLGVSAQLWQQDFLPAYQSASPENRAALLLAAPGIQSPASAQSYVDWIRSEPDMRSEYVAQLLSWNDFENGEFLLAAASIPDLDMPTREKLFKAATRLFFPNINAKPAKKLAFAKKVLTAAPEGPIRDSVLQTMNDAKLSK
jgi:HEAT repeat protein